ncbi:MAG TPA: hypothetical protein VMO00_05435 [Methylomirabilota bacterium]|nr:hypothetical protein [Methylomirabilota bacterium]
MKVAIYIIVISLYINNQGLKWCQVTSVSEARREVLCAGGKAVGDVVSLETSAGRTVTWCYVTDPEGNIIELQFMVIRGAD